MVPKGKKYKGGVTGLSGRAAAHTNEQERKNADGSHERRRSKRLRKSVVKHSRIENLFLDPISESSP